MRVGLAGDAVYKNDAIVTYPGTQTFPPVIDATNFINTGTFIINFTSISLPQPFYETSDTMNYTNTGVMMANTGFQFDNQPGSGTGARTPAANFYNSGAISGGSINNTNDPYGGVLGQLGYAQCWINATNIVNPGGVDAGLDGLISFTGHNVDLSHAALNIENGSITPAGTGVFGVNSNQFLTWDPSLYLGANYSESAYFPLAPYFLYLTNSTAYIKQDGAGTSNVLTRAVFIQDTSGSNVAYNVYFNTSGIGFGSGSVTIEWVGSYLNVADGTTLNNYLYLNNNYILGASTNVVINANGIPDNFTFVESPTRILTGVPPAAAGFSNVFPSGALTNAYSFGNAQMISTTVSTNGIQDQSITNLPGRIEISAANELNLAAARITGPNYLSVQSPHQFDGSPGAVIQSPYSDLNLGVTNGFLTISNLLSPTTPNWSGTVQAWSTRWLSVVSGVTNDYRVVIVGSQLNPVFLAQVQNMILHGTNSIVISDALNVMRTFKADAQNLTLTTNGPGNGATSLDGELNVGSANIFSWAGSLPNLRNLTNNGAIRFQNLAQFNRSSNNVVVTPGIAATAATGTLSEVVGRTNVMANNKMIIGTNAYVFVGKLTNTVPNQVVIAAKFDGTMSNLIAAINGGAGAGTAYTTSTLANGQVAAGMLTNHAFTVSALIAGSAGNSIYTALSTPTTNVVWGTNYLAGGADATPGSTNIDSTVSLPYDNFINNGLLSDQGSTIWANNFENSGTISNGFGSFNLTCQTTTWTNGLVVAGGDVVIAADNLVISNVNLQVSRSLSLTVSNLLSDGGVTNGNIWTVQSTNGTGGNGLILPVKPAMGDLLGTTITNIAAGPNQQNVNVWAGKDYGATAAGYTNNVAVGRLVLDALGSVSQFQFSGASTKNAIYVDDLEFSDYMTNGIYSSFDFSVNLSINPNVMIYFAQAKAGGVSIAAKIDAASKAGRNGGRLRWVPSYAGHFSSVDLVYPDGTTNVVNAALAASSTIDSDGDGIPNVKDPEPFFVGSQIGLRIGVTNAPVPAAIIQWNSIPGATNFVYYKTNLTSQTWFTLTNYVSPSIVPPVGGWPIVNTVTDIVNSAQARFYNVTVMPNTAQLYGQ